MDIAAFCHPIKLQFQMNEWSRWDWKPNGQTNFTEFQSRILSKMVCIFECTLTIYIKTGAILKQKKTNDDIGVISIPAKKVYSGFSKAVELVEKNNLEYLIPKYQGTRSWGWNYPYLRILTHEILPFLVFGAIRSNGG